MDSKIEKVSQLPTIFEEYNRRKRRALEKQKRSHVIEKKLPQFTLPKKFDHKESYYINSVLGDYELLAGIGILKELGITKEYVIPFTPQELVPPDEDTGITTRIEKLKSLQESLPFKEEELKKIKEDPQRTEICKKCFARSEKRKSRMAKKIAEKDAQLDRVLMPPPPKPY